MKDLKEVFFAYCSAAADKAIIGPNDPINREGGNREQEAKFSALLSVIVDAGLGEEYRQYEQRQSLTAYSGKKEGKVQWLK